MQTVGRQELLSYQLRRSGEAPVRLQRLTLRPSACPGDDCEQPHGKCVRDATTASRMIFTASLLATFFAMISPSHVIVTAARFPSAANRAPIPAPIAAAASEFWTNNETVS